MRYMGIGKGLSASAVLLVFFLLLGCTGNGQTAVAPEPAEEASTGDPPAVKRPVDGESALPNEPADSAGVKKGQIEVASPAENESEPAADTAPDQSDRDSMSLPEKPHHYYDVHDSFDAVHPTLMGLNTETTLEAVQDRFGEPADKYTLPDEGSDASVLAYPGFVVGISGNRVLFVEVSSPSINPGLNGLRVGATATEAIAEIGEPTARTEYVLTYKSDGVVLKLDVDPKNDVIQSIKLFPEEKTGS